jgi:hypothetical protein
MLHKSTFFGRNLIEATVPDLSFLCAGLSSRIPLRNASAALGGPGHWQALGVRHWG